MRDRSSIIEIAFQQEIQLLVGAVGRALMTLSSHNDQDGMSA